jgi:hypothetical protein
VEVVRYHRIDVQQCRVLREGQGELEDGFNADTGSKLLYQQKQAMKR